MRILVVDDEAPARERLCRLLRDIPDTHVVGEARDGEEAIAQVQAVSPELMLLDVQMPKITGISMAQRFTDLPPIIFVTAYDTFAVQAFDLNAVDYLLKPVRPERLRAAIDRARERLGARAPASNTAAVLEQLAPVATSTRIVTHERGTVRFFDALEVTRFWASDKYTLFLSDGVEHCTEEALSSLEDRLAAHGFVRVHRGELISLSKVRAFTSADGIHEVTLSDGQRARVSRRSVSVVRTALGLET